MSMQTLRNLYGPQIKRGARIRYTGEPGPAHEGTIVGTRGAYIRVRIETLHRGGIHTLHPTWEVEYLDDNAGAVPRRGSDVGTSPLLAVSESGDK